MALAKSAWKYAKGPLAWGTALTAGGAVMNSASVNAAKNNLDEIENDISVKQASKSNKNTALGIGAAALAAGGVYGGIKVAQGFNNYLDKKSWSKRGCDNVPNSKKNECLAYVKNDKIKKLNIIKSKCQDQNCMQNVSNQITNLMRS